MQQGRDRARPQGPRRPRRQRPRRVRRHRRAGEERARTLRRVDAFRQQARHFAGPAPLYARLSAELEDDSLLVALVGDEVAGRTPLQLFAGLHYLVLSGRGAWDDVRAMLRDESEFLAGWLAEQHVQTNEVGRCRWLLPCFLEVARRTGAEAVDCVELGCSGGLNLLWDRYGYRYERGAWGAGSSLVLAGEERAPVPAELLALAPAVRSRVGVDRDPPDLRDDDAVRVLQAFVWPGEHERLERLDAAVAIWREDPPDIAVGEMVDLLPALLERRRDDALLLVWQSAALNYLPREGQQRVRELLAEAGEEGPLAFVETWRPLDGSHDHYGLFVQIWPSGERVEVAHADFHGAWLAWRA
ncbi:MAG TPA: DUF2332 domain-containing protein [Gaiellaceae bacterium]|nr:DUF2332 domain-containing protein [Gaiellaceae bacterium]